MSRNRNGVFSAINNYFAKVRTQSILNQMDDHLRDDIGLPRNERQPNVESSIMRQYRSW